MGISIRFGLSEFNISGSLNITRREVQEEEFDPTSISGCLAWFKADAGVTKDGSNVVSQWDDQSGNDNHLVQASASRRPTWVDSVQNGKPIIRTVDDWMDLTSVLSTVRTVFVVVNHAAGGANAYAPVLGDVLNNYPTQTRPAFQGDASTSSTGPMISTTYAAANVLNGSGYVDGTLTAIGSIARSATMKVYSFVTAGNIHIGNMARDGYDSLRIWKGDFAEIILYSAALSNDDRILVQDYLADKWGTA